MSKRPVLQAVVPPLAAGLIRLLHATTRSTFLHRERMLELDAEGQPFLLAFWHSRILLMRYSHPGTRTLGAVISQHGDGELIARAVARLGHPSVRGSSTRGGAQAVRDALRFLADGNDLAITPDGPKGPARVAKWGVVELSRASGAKILPVSLAASRAKVFASWDRFILPLPGARLVYAYGEPMACPREASPEDRSALAAELSRRLDALTAECLAELGLPPEEPAG